MSRASDAWVSSHQAASLLGGSILFIQIAAKRGLIDTKRDDSSGLVVYSRRDVERLLHGLGGPIKRPTANVEVPV